jgi:RimJ/RimL family protein N-acetyltransferase
MNPSSVFDDCPVYHCENVTLKQTSMEDSEELLKCYSDEKAFPFFNADNCINNFQYLTLGQMQKGIQFWVNSYQSKRFMRWTISINQTSEKVGTIEMFNRGVLPGKGSHGILRIDLRSDYEAYPVIRDILQIANQHFYRDFQVDWIYTKAIPAAKERIIALQEMGYEPVAFELPDYFARDNN